MIKAQDKQVDKPAMRMTERLRGNPSYPVFYMFIITSFFTVILVAVSTLTRSRVEANRQIMRERALLMAALPEEVDRQTPSIRVNQIYRQRVKPPTDPDRDPLYQVMDERSEEQTVAYALPLSGQGFWDTIEGFLALQPDQETIIGIAFHQQNETPGLGAQIITSDFRQQFQGKEIADQEPWIKLLAASEEPDRHSVHAITGATQTSNRLERIINQEIKAWQGITNPSGKDE